MQLCVGEEVCVDRNDEGKSSARKKEAYFYHSGDQLLARVGDMKRKARKVERQGMNNVTPEKAMRNQ